MGNFQKIEPQLVWNFFNEICKIPRPSKKEEKIIAYLVEFGKNNNLETLTDSTGNVVIKKSATKGYENRKGVVLQSHMDMVCEKEPEVIHDFYNDPITPVIDGDWISAKGTTLGADDGIGMATQLAILASKDLEHPALECLFTVDEETGLTGAYALNSNFISHRTLINLDSEDEGQIFIGCAGGIDTIATFNYRSRPAPSGCVAFKIEVKGLHGGHSGDDIHKGYGNSNKILNRFLWSASRKYNVRLQNFDGGNLRNAIPRDATAIVVVKEKYITSFEKEFSNFCKMIFKEIKKNEPKLSFELNKVEMPRFVMKMKDQIRLLNAIYACPNGVIALSKEMEGLVETSTNLASVKFYEGNIIEVITSQRSSIDSAKQDIADMVTSVFDMAGAMVHHSDGYPGWKPNMDSKLLKVAVDSYQQLFNKKPVVRAIHAGLECGLFLEKFSEMDMISIGPTLKNVHSPTEKINIKTVELFWTLLLDILKKTK